MKLRTSLLLAAAVSGVLLSGNACLMNESCSAEPVTVTNVTTVVNSGWVTVTWDYPAYDPVRANQITAKVQYAAAGGSAERCSTYIPQEGCVVGCTASGQTGCNVNGLTPGTSYSFSVVTNSQATNPSCTNAEAAAFSGTVTP